MAAPAVLADACVPKEGTAWRAVGYVAGEGLLLHEARCESPTRVRARFGLLAPKTGKLRDGRKTPILARVDANFLEKAWRVGLSPNGRFLAIVGVRQEEGGFLAVLGQDTPKKQVVHRDNTSRVGPIIGTDKARRPHGVFVTDDAGKVVLVGADYSVSVWRRHGNLSSGSVGGADNGDGEAAWTGSWHRVIATVDGGLTPAHAPSAFDSAFVTEHEFVFTSVRLGAAAVGQPPMSAFVETGFRDPLPAEGYLRTAKFALRRDNVLPAEALQGLGPRTSRQCVVITSTVGSLDHVSHAYGVAHTAGGAASTTTIPVVSGYVGEYAMPLREEDLRPANAVPRIRWDPEATLTASLLATASPVVVFATPGHPRVHATPLPAGLGQPEDLVWVGNGLFVACCDRAGNVAVVARLGCVLKMLPAKATTPCMCLAAGAGAGGAARHVMGTIATQASPEHTQLAVSTGAFVQVVHLPACSSLAIAEGGGMRGYDGLVPDAPSAIRLFCTLRWVLSMISTDQVYVMLSGLLVGRTPITADTPAEEITATLVQTIVTFKACIKALYWVAGVVRQSFTTVTELTHYLMVLLINDALYKATVDGVPAKVVVTALEAAFHTVKWCENAVWEIATLSELHMRMERGVAVGRWFFKEYWLTLERRVGEVLQERKGLAGGPRQTLAVLHDVLLSKIKTSCTLPPAALEILPQNIPSARPVLKAHDQYIRQTGDCGVELYADADRNDCRFTTLLLRSRPDDATGLLGTLLPPKLAAWGGKGLVHAPELLGETMLARLTTAVASLLSGVMFALKVQVLPPIFCDVEETLVLIDKYSDAELAAMAPEPLSPLSPTVRDFFNNRDSWTGKGTDDTEAAQRVTQHLALPATTAHACAQYVARHTRDQTAAFAAELWCANGFPLEALHIALSHELQATADRVLALCNWQVWSQEPWEMTHLADVTLPCANPPLNWQEMDQFLLYRTCRRVAHRAMEADEASAKILASCSAKKQAVRHGRVCPTCFSSLLLFFILHAVRRGAFAFAQHVLGIPYATGGRGHAAVLRQAAATQVVAVAKAILSALPAFSVNIAIDKEKTASPVEIVHGVLRGVEEPGEDIQRALREYFTANKEGVKPFALKVSGREAELLRAAAKLLAWALVFLVPAEPLGRCSDALLPLVDVYEKVFKRKKGDLSPEHPICDQIRATLRYLWALEIYYRVHTETSSAQGFLVLPPSWRTPDAPTPLEPTLSRSGAEWVGKLVYFADDLWEQDVTQGALLSALELCTDPDGVFAAVSTAFHEEADREHVMQISQTKKGQYNRIVRELPEALQRKLKAKQAEAFKVFAEHEGSNKKRFDPSPHPLLTKLEHAQEATAKHLLHRRQWHFEGDDAYWGFVDELVGGAPVVAGGGEGAAPAHPAKPGWAELVVLTKFLKLSSDKLLVVPFGVSPSGERLAAKGAAGGVAPQIPASPTSPKTPQQPNGGGGTTEQNGGGTAAVKSPKTGKNEAKDTTKEKAATLLKTKAGDHVKEVPTLVEAATSPDRKTIVAGTAGEGGVTSPPRSQIVPARGESPLRPRSAMKERPVDLNLPYELLPVGHGGLLLDVDESSSSSQINATTILAASPSRLLGQPPAGGGGSPVRDHLLQDVLQSLSPSTAVGAGAGGIPLGVRTPDEVIYGRGGGTGTVAPPGSRTTMTTETSSNGETSYTNTSTTVTSTRQPTQRSATDGSSTSIPDPVDVRAALTPPRAGRAKPSHGKHDRDQRAEKRERRRRRDPSPRDGRGAAVEPGHDNRGVGQVHYHYNEVYGGDDADGGRHRRHRSRSGGRRGHQCKKHRHGHGHRGHRAYDDVGRGLLPPGARDHSRRRRRRREDDADDLLLSSLPPPPVPSHVIGDAMARANLAARASPAAHAAAANVTASLLKPNPAVSPPPPAAAAASLSPPQPVLLKPSDVSGAGGAPVTPAKLTAPPTPHHVFPKPLGGTGEGAQGKGGLVSAPGSPVPLTEPKVPPPDSELLAPGLGVPSTPKSATTPPPLGAAAAAGADVDTTSVALSPMGTPMATWMNKAGTGAPPLPVAAVPSTPKSTRESGHDVMSVQGGGAGTPAASPLPVGSPLTPAGVVSPPHPLAAGDVVPAAARPAAAATGAAEPTTLIGQPVLTATEELLYAKYIKHLGITSADAVITGGIPVISKYTPTPEDVDARAAAAAGSAKSGGGGVLPASTVNVPDSLEELNDRHRAMQGVGGAAAAAPPISEPSIAAAARVVADAVSALAQAETMGAKAAAVQQAAQPQATAAATPAPAAAAPAAAAAAPAPVKTEEQLKQEAKQQASLEDLLTTMLQRQEAVASESGKELATAFAETLKNLSPAVAGSLQAGTLEGQQLQRQGMVQFLRQEGTAMQMLARERERNPELLAAAGANQQSRVDGSGQAVRPLDDAEYEKWAERQKALASKPQTADVSVDAAERPGVGLQTTLDAKATEAQGTQAGGGFLSVRELDQTNYDAAAAAAATTDTDTLGVGLGPAPPEGDRTTDEILGITSRGAAGGTGMGGGHPERAFLNVQDTHGHAGRYKDRFGEQLPERRLDGARREEVASWALRASAAKLDHDIDKVTRRVDRVERTIHEASTALVSSEAVLRDAQRLRGQRELQVSMDQLRGEAAKVEARLAAEVAKGRQPPKGVRPLQRPEEGAVVPPGLRTAASGTSPYPQQGPSRGVVDSFTTRCVTPVHPRVVQDVNAQVEHSAASLPSATVQMSPAPQAAIVDTTTGAALAAVAAVQDPARPQQEYLSTTSTTAFTPALPAHAPAATPAGTTSQMAVLQSMVEEDACGREPFVWQHTTQKPVRQYGVAAQPPMPPPAVGTPAAPAAAAAAAAPTITKEVEATPGGDAAMAGALSAGDYQRLGMAGVSELMPAVLPRNLEKEMERSPARSAVPSERPGAAGTRRIPFKSVNVNDNSAVARRSKSGGGTVRSASPYSVRTTSSAATRGGPGTRGARGGKPTAASAPQRRHPAVPLALQSQIDELGAMLKDI